MSSAPVSTRRYQDLDSGSLNLRAERSSLLASWLRLSLAAILNGRIMQHDCNLFDQVGFAKSEVLLQKCSIITSHLAIFFSARGFAPRTPLAYKSLLYKDSLEFLVRPHGIFIGGRLSAPLAVVKVLKTLDLRCAQAATAIAGGPVERTGPDFR